jgi:endonuclease YncB( thermonuclease family)
MRWHEVTDGGRAIAALAVCLAVAVGAPARGDQAAATASGTTTVGSGTVPYWQAPPLPSAVIQGGAIPAGWQPQAVPYRGVGPDGRPMTMYFAPTYVFTYQAGPPVLAAPPVNRRPSVTYAPSPWNYQAQGVPAVPVALPPATVARYQPAPYQFPPDARALSGTPVVPPATPLPAPPPMALPPAPSPYGYAPAQQVPLPPQVAPPPQQWVPSNAPPPPGMAPAGGGGWAGAAPVAAATVPLAAAAVATAPNPPPTVSLSPPPSIPTSGTPVAATSSRSMPAPLPPGASATNTHVWKVVGVHDGDTVTCLDEANQQQKIRLAEIDAPEVSQDFGKVSREALAGMVFGKTIQVVDDGRDRYGRWIGHLYVDGLDVNRQMVATGMAWHYAAYSKDASLGTLQSQAQAQRLGLWSQPNPLPPWEYRKNGKKKTA